MRKVALLPVIALIAALFLLPTSRAFADNICTPALSWGTLNPSYEAEVIALVNAHRANLGLSQLKLDSALTASAEWKSMNMAGLDYFDHPDDPIGRDVGQRLADCGYVGNFGWGENIAYGYLSPDQVMTGWLNSAGHKANIEDPSYNYIGVGVAANAQGVYYWTQDFGTGPSPGSAHAPASVPAPVTAPVPVPPVAVSPPTVPSAPAPIPPSSPSTPPIGESKPVAPIEKAVPSQPLSSQSPGKRAAARRKAARAKAKAHPHPRVLKRKRNQRKLTHSSHA